VAVIAAATAATAALGEEEIWGRLGKGRGGHLLEQRQELRRAIGVRNLFRIAF
jgi:hypothetical protein